MIWASTASGVVTYAGPEWALVTGQPIAETLGSGWAAMLHPDDRARVRRYFEQACETVSIFRAGYRLRRIDGSYAQIVSAAAPSISPIDGRFIGFLGSLIEVDDQEIALPPERSVLNAVGRIALPQPRLSMAPSSELDKLCDSILMARTEAEAAGETALFACLDLAVSIVFGRLGVPTSSTH